MAPAVSKTKVVRVACDGEGESIQRLQGYDVPTSHEIFGQGAVSALSQRLGFTLLIQKVFPSMKQPKITYRHNRPDHMVKPPPPPKYGYTPGTDYFPNQLAGLLMLGDQAWRDSVGSVMVARQDGEPLLVEHLEFLWQYLDEVLLGGGPEPISQADQATLMTPEFFKMYYEEKIRENAELAAVPSPFGNDTSKQADVNVKEVKMDEDVDMDRGSGY